MMNNELDLNELRKGTALLSRGKQKQAIAVLEPLHAAAADNFDVALNLGAAYILDKKFQQAVEVLEPLRDDHGDNANLWVNLGAAYLGNPVLADDDQQFNAVVAFSIALKLDPKAPNVAYNLGLIHKDRKEYDVAFRWFGIALKTNPDDKDAAYWLEQLATDTIDLDEVNDDE